MVPVTAETEITCERGGTALAHAQHGECDMLRLTEVQTWIHAHLSSKLLLPDCRALVHHSEAIATRLKGGCKHARP